MMELKFYDRIAPKSDSELIDIYRDRNEYQPEFTQTLTKELENRRLLGKAELIASFSEMSEEDLLEIKAEHTGDDLIVHAADKALEELEKKYERPYEPGQRAKAVKADTLPVPEERLATTGTRFVNYLVDMGIIVIGLFAIFSGIGGVLSEDDARAVALILAIIYYLFFEWLLSGRTPGKLLTDTRIVNDKGEQPSFGQVVARTFCRFIPFEPVSTFFGRPWHDRITGTYVIRNEKRNGETGA